MRFLPIRAEGFTCSLSPTSHEVVTLLTFKTEISRPGIIFAPNVTGYSGYKKPQLANDAGVHWSGGGDGCPINKRHDTPSVLTEANYKLVMTIDKASQCLRTQKVIGRTQHDTGRGFRKLRPAR